MGIVKPVIEAYNYNSNKNLITEAYNKGEINYLKFKSEKKFLFHDCVNNILKVTVGISGIGYLSAQGADYTHRIIGNPSFSVDLLKESLPQNGLLIGAAAVATTLFGVYTLANRYKESFSFDTKKRAFLLEVLTSDLELNDGKELLKTVPTDSAYMYIRMMNGILTKDKTLDKGINGLVCGLTFIKDCFSTIKNFQEITKNKGFEALKEFQILEKLLNSKNDNEIKSIAQKNISFFERSRNTLYRTFVKDITNLSEQNLKDQVSMYTKNIKGKHAGIKADNLESLFDINENCLNNAYNIDMSQRLVLKFAKVIKDALDNGNFPKGTLKKFAMLPYIVQEKDSKGLVGNDIHNRIAKVANSFLKDRKGFIEKHKNSSLVNIVKYLDNAMISDDNKIVYQDFRSIFFSVRDKYLSDYNSSLCLKDIISEKLKGTVLSAENIIHNQSKSVNNNKEWVEAAESLVKRKKMIKNQK